MDKIICCFSLLNILVASVGEVAILFYQKTLLVKVQFVGMLSSSGYDTDDFSVDLTCIHIFILVFILINLIVCIKLYRKSIIP